MKVAAIGKAMKKRQKHFSWLKTFIKEFLKTYPCNNHAIQVLLRDVENEVNNLSSDGHMKSESLFETINDLFLHFWWKIHSLPVRQWKKYWKIDSPYAYQQNEFTRCFGKLLYFLIYLGIILSRGASDSLWINRVLQAINILPSSDDNVYSALLLINNLKKKHRNTYMVILKHVLCSEIPIHISEPEVYIKSIMLFRRLKKFTEDEVAKTAIISTASKIKPPSNIVSWLSSLNISIKANKNIVNQLFQKSSNGVFQKLYKDLIKPEQPNKCKRSSKTFSKEKEEEKFRIKLGRLTTKKRNKKSKKLYQKTDANKEKNSDLENIHNRVGKKSREKKGSKIKIAELNKSAEVLVNKENDVYLSSLNVTSHSDAHKNSVEISVSQTIDLPDNELIAVGKKDTNESHLSKHNNKKKSKKENSACCSDKSKNIKLSLDIGERQAVETVLENSLVINQANKELEESTHLNNSSNFHAYYGTAQENEMRSISSYPVTVSDSTVLVLDSCQNDTDFNVPFNLDFWEDSVHSSQEECEASQNSFAPSAKDQDSSDKIPCVVPASVTNSQNIDLPEYELMDLSKKDKNESPLSKCNNKKNSKKEHKNARSSDINIRLRPDVTESQTVQENSLVNQANKELEKNTYLNNSSNLLSNYDITQENEIRSISSCPITISDSTVLVLDTCQNDMNFTEPFNLDFWEDSMNSSQDEPEASQNSFTAAAENQDSSNKVPCVVPASITNSPNTDLLENERTDFGKDKSESPSFKRNNKKNYKKEIKTARNSDKIKNIKISHDISESQTAETVQKNYLIKQATKDLEESTHLNNSSDLLANYGTTQENEMSISSCPVTISDSSVLVLDTCQNDTNFNVPFNLDFWEDSMNSSQEESDPSQNSFAPAAENQDSSGKIPCVVPASITNSTEGFNSNINNPILEEVNDNKVCDSSDHTSDDCLNRDIIMSEKVHSVLQNRNEHIMGNPTSVSNNLENDYLEKNASQCCKQLKLDNHKTSSDETPLQNINHRKNPSSCHKKSRRVSFVDESDNSIHSLKKKSSRSKKAKKKRKNNSEKKKKNSNVNTLIKLNDQSDSTEHLNSNIYDPILGEINDKEVCAVSDCALNDCSNHNITMHETTQCIPQNGNENNTNEDSMGSPTSMPENLENDRLVKNASPYHKKLKPSNLTTSSNEIHLQNNTNGIPLSYRKQSERRLSCVYDTDNSIHSLEEKISPSKKRKNTSTKEMKNSNEEALIKLDDQSRLTENLNANINDPILGEISGNEVCAASGHAPDGCSNHNSEINETVHCILQKRNENNTNEDIMDTSTSENLENDRLEKDASPCHKQLKLSNLNTSSDEIHLQNNSHKNNPSPCHKQSKRRMSLINESNDNIHSLTEKVSSSKKTKKKRKNNSAKEKKNAETSSDVNENKNIQVNCECDHSMETSNKEFNESTYLDDLSNLLGNHGDPVSQENRQVVNGNASPVEKSFVGTTSTSDSAASHSNSPDLSHVHRNGLLHDEHNTSGHHLEPIIRNQGIFHKIPCVSLLDFKKKSPNPLLNTNNQTNVSKNSALSTNDSAPEYFSENKLPEVGDNSPNNSFSFELTSELTNSREQYSENPKETNENTFDPSATNSSPTPSISFNSNNLTTPLQQINERNVIISTNSSATENEPAESEIILSPLNQTVIGGCNSVVNSNRTLNNKDESYKQEHIITTNVNMTSNNSSYVIDCNINNDYGSNNTSHPNMSVNSGIPTIKVIVNLNCRQSEEFLSSSTPQITGASQNNFVTHYNQSEGIPTLITSSQELNQLNYSLSRNNDYFEEPPLLTRAVDEIETPPTSEHPPSVMSSPKAKKNPTPPNKLHSPHSTNKTNADPSFPKNASTFKVSSSQAPQTGSASESEFLTPHSSDCDCTPEWAVNTLDLNSSFCYIPSSQMRSPVNIFDSFNLSKSANNIESTRTENNAPVSRLQKNSTPKKSTRVKPAKIPKRTDSYRHSTSHIYSDASSEDVSVSTMSLLSGEETDHSLIRTTDNETSPLYKKKVNDLKKARKHLFQVNPQSNSNCTNQWSDSSKTLTSESSVEDSELAKQSKNSASSGKRKRKVTTKKVEKPNNSINHAYNLRSRRALVRPSKLSSYIV